jgi:hypothetical protein
MALIEHTIDDSMVGQTIGRWLTGYFVLRDGGVRDVICCSPQTSGGFGPGGSGELITGGSIGFKGQLMIIAVPRGSTWALTLSDVPVVRTVDPRWATWSPSIHSNWPREAELQPVPR